MKEALITKIISKRYTLLTPEGNSFVAELAGKVRKLDYPVVGDIALYERYCDHYVIQGYKDRRNYLIRPNLANIDQVIVVMSIHDPDFSYELCNRLIMLIEYNDIKPILCISKNDLSEPSRIKEITDYYQKIGYLVYTTGKNDDADFIKVILKDKITALCGQSGVGKSTLLNKIDPLLNIKTQAISKALNRGKHTTRHIELYHCFDGFLADTPGFSAIDLTSVDKDLLASKISAFDPYVGKCRFLDCHHLNEPDCCLKMAVTSGAIPKTFYETYKNLMNFLINNNLSANRHRTYK